MGQELLVQQLWELGGKVALPQLNTVTLPFLEEISHEFVFNWDECGAGGEAGGTSYQFYQ